MGQTLFSFSQSMLVSSLKETFFFWLHCRQGTKSPDCRELSPVTPQGFPHLRHTPGGGLTSGHPAPTRPQCTDKLCSLQWHKTNPSMSRREEAWTPSYPPATLTHTPLMGQSRHWALGRALAEMPSPDLLELHLLNKNKVQRQKVSRAKERSRIIYGV